VTPLPAMRADVFLVGPAGNGPCNLRATNFSESAAIYLLGLAPQSPEHSNCAGAPKIAGRSQKGPTRTCEVRAMEALILAAAPSKALVAERSDRACLFGNRSAHRRAG
jgi:hypothetical protein